MALARAAATPLLFGRSRSGYSRSGAAPSSTAASSSAPRLTRLTDRQGLTPHARHQGYPLARYHQHRSLIPMASSFRPWPGEEDSEQEDWPRV
ncbi:hypothetical protein [Thermogemmatispora sp.]|uniref:hypothetical protein n=1 Tax=Thermogemmatispora sp. TaxID=1968838 RepID=UPI0035E454DA